MKYIKYIGIFVLAACLVLCVGGCGNREGDKEDFPSQGDDFKSERSKDNTKPADSEISSGGSVATEGAVTTGGAVVSAGTIQVSSGASIGAIEAPDMAAPEQKEEYEKLSKRMEELYSAITSVYSGQMEEAAYEDFRYFEPIYEYYHGIMEEKCENIKKEEMERVLKGIGEYLTALEEFAKGHSIEIPAAD